VSGSGLTPAEVEALAAGVAAGTLPSGQGLRPRGPVTPHVFGVASPQLSGELGALAILHERFARALRRALLPLLRFQPRVALGPITSQPYDDYVGALRQGLACFNIVRVERLRGNILVAVAPELVSALVDGFFGGQGRAAGRAGTEFTPTEERVIQRLVEGMCLGLGRAWEDVAPLRFAFAGTESNAQLAIFLEQDDAVLVCPFEVGLGEGDCRIDILYPIQLLKPVLPALRSKVQTERVAASADWRERLTAAVLDLPLELRAVVAEPVASVRLLARLAPGELIPMQPAGELRLMVGEVAIGTGIPGEVGGRAAVRLERRLLGAEAPGQADAAAAGEAPAPPALPAPAPAPAAPRSAAAGASAGMARRKAA
jgi:flagellar motor switch protein FliM